VDGPQNGLEVVQPFLAAGLEFGVEAFCLWALEDFSIGMLYLPITLGVGDGGEVNLDAK
jgi:hypothetical protein